METEKRPVIGRIIALFEVLLCSDYPTQFGIGATLYAFGLRPKTAAGLYSLRYIVILSLVDTALLLGLIFFFLRAHGERVRPVLLGVRSRWKEAELGLPLTIGALVIAGGIREEVQRAFILHRFDVWLGGPIAGLVASSIAFGLGHQMQGNDVALATGMLGVYWGVVYLRRRSCIAPMVSHAGFNLIELLQFFVVGR